MTKHLKVTPKNCPPKDAASSSDTFYRIVYNNPPISDDFVITVLEPDNKRKVNDKKGKQDCRIFAMSMFNSEAASLRKLKEFRRGCEKRAEIRGGKFLGVARVELDENSGVVKQTGQDQAHYSLWPFVT